MKFVVFLFIILQLYFEIIKAQSFSFYPPHVQFESSREQPINSYSFYQYENVLPTNNQDSMPVYDKKLKLHRNKIDINPSFNNIERKNPYHTLNTWIQNVPPNNVNQIPYLMYHSENQPSNHPNKNYLTGIITKAGDAVKETADENHNASKNSINSLVAASVANTNAVKDLIQSGLAFGTSFPRFGSKLFGQSDNSQQKNGFNMGSFSF